MKLLLYTDNHWCDNSSIIRSRGEGNVPTRLLNQIKSLNWVSDMAHKYNCSQVMCLGDFFDKDTLNSEELTALGSVQFYDDLGYTLLVGNHEAGINSLEVSSAHLFRLDNKCKVIDTPQTVNFDGGATEICFLPYTLECNRTSLEEVFGGKKEGIRRIILSHNDISGINYGGFISNIGYEISDIQSHCDLFINGHLHNGAEVAEGVINLGNLTGQNFSEDAHKYRHCIMILDTETLTYEYIDNPYAFNFYKLDCTNGDYVNKLSSLKDNAVITVKCKEEDVTAVKDEIASHPNIIESRVIIDRVNTMVDTSEIEEDLLADMNHLEEFKSFVLQTVGDTDVVREELSEVCK